MSRSERFGRAGGVVAAHVEQAQDRLGRVPFLAEGGLGPLDGVPGQFPVAVQPVGVAHHDDDAVLAVAGRQVFGHLGGQVLGRHADVELAALDALLRASPSRRCSRGGGDLHGMIAGSVAARLGVRASRRLSSLQGLDQFVLPHAVPAGDMVTAGQLDQLCLVQACNWSRVMRDNSGARPTQTPQKFPGGRIHVGVQAPGGPFQGGNVFDRRRDRTVRERRIGEGGQGR